MNKKTGIIVIAISVVLILSGVILMFISPSKKEESSGSGNEEKNERGLEKLPLPEVTGGERGQLGIDKNINESNIDEYLNRSDAVYRDMRMLEDPAQYENIGGDRFLSGYIKGFEIVPLPYLMPVSGLPEAVGSTYSGNTLFKEGSSGNIIANYKESIQILESLFPKDKVIFLMCGGGGYAGMTKNLLVSLGWDETKIYNIGGFWYYDGNNKVIVEKTDAGYDFSNVPYHEIKFEELTPIDNSNVEPTDPTPAPIEPTSSTTIYLDDKYYNNNAGVGIEGINLYQYKNEYTALAGTDKAGEIETKIENASVEGGNKINQMLDNKESFVILLTNDDFCYSTVEGTGDAEEETTLEQNMYNLGKENDLYYYNIGLRIYKKSRLYQEIKYAPSVIIIYKGEILAYTDAESDEDLILSKSKEEFNKWFKSYVYVTKEGN